MAAGLGFIEFSTGDVLSAAAANGYLASQTVMVFASAAARTSAIASPQEGMVSFLKDTDTMQFYTGSAWSNVDTGSSPLTTKGDLYGFSTTNARVPVGTNGQVLTADSTQGLGVKWATPAASSSGMTLIARTSFSNVAGQAFDAVFSSTYSTYFVAIEQIYAATGDDDLQMQLRYSGPTTQQLTYYGSTYEVPFTGTNVTTQTNNAAQMTIARQTGSSGTVGSGHIYFNMVGDASAKPNFRGLYVDKDANQYMFGGQNDTSRSYTGFLLKSSSTNITGTVAIYGMAE